MIYRVIMDGNDILNFQEPAFILLTPTLNMELNTAGSFEVTMPPNHAFYENVRPLTATVEVYEDGRLLWFGRPVELETDYWKQRRVYCEGALSFFNDSAQRPHEYDSISLHSFFQAVIANHNEQVSASRQFTVGTVTIPDKTVYRKLRYESTFDVLKRQCLNAEGGYFFLRRENGVNYIDWLAEMPYRCNQPVEFGLNLLDITSQFNGASITTCVIPLGDTVEETGEPLTVAAVNGGSDTIESEAAAAYGRITKAVTFSGVKGAATLYQDGLEYLQNTQFDNLVISCTASELHFQNSNYEQFRVGQTIRCRSVPHLVDREFPLMRMSLRLDTAAKQITLGSAAKQTLTQIYKETQENPATAEDLAELRQSLEGLDQAVGGIGEELSGLGDAMSGLEDTLGALSDTVEGFDGAINGLDEAMDGLGTDFEALGGTVSALGDQVSDLQFTVDNLPSGGGSGGGISVVSVDYLPANPAANTLYLIRAYTDYNNSAGG